MSPNLLAALDRFEALMTAVIEGSFTRLWPVPLQPVDLARRLAAAMEEAERDEPAGRVVPNVYTLALNPQDWVALAPFRSGLEAELARYVRGAAEERGVVLYGSPQVRVVENQEVPERGVRVTAAFAAPEATLVVSGGLRGWRLVPAAPAPPCPLAPPRVTLGRARDNDLVVDDPRVSRYHAELCFGVDGWSVRDLDSTNGTFVNGVRVAACALRAGDRLHLGDTEFTLAADPA